MFNSVVKAKFHNFLWVFKMFIDLRKWYSKEFKGIWCLEGHWVKTVIYLFMLNHKLDY